MTRNYECERPAGSICPQLSDQLGLVGTLMKNFVRQQSGNWRSFAYFRWLSGATLHERSVGCSRSMQSRSGPAGGGGSCMLKRLTTPEQWTENRLLSSAGSPNAVMHNVTKSAHSAGSFMKAILTKRTIVAKVTPLVMGY